jgi:uncharacterized protein (DUF1330 family)
MVVLSTALTSPSYDGQPAVYLYIAALEVNVLNCRWEDRRVRRGQVGRVRWPRVGDVADEETKVYALNLFDIADREEYLAYSRRSAREVARHGGRVLALGRFRESMAGDITPRQVLILVEWESRAAFEGYCQDPALADLHPHRERGTSAYVWHLFDRLDDLRPLLRP